MTLDTTGDALRRLHQLHEEVTDEAATLARRHADRLQCGRGCHGCCSDGITVFEIEAERIRQARGDLLADATPHAEDGCAFLDPEGACRIYEDRPYVCRTQGLPLRWLDEQPDRSVELRDICPLNELPDAPLEGLAGDECWEIGPYEGRLAQLQIEFGGAPTRISLRSLWSGDAD
jgi:hypothetical protein